MLRFPSPSGRGADPSVWRVLYSQPVRQAVSVAVLLSAPALVGCEASQGDPRDAESLASMFCRVTLKIQQKAQPHRFSSCMRQNLPKATLYGDCLADAGEFAVESEQFRCMDEVNWSPYSDRSLSVGLDQTWNGVA